jgi:uncharacterized RDD family membrane protein YckC
MVTSSTSPASLSKRLIAKIIDGVLPVVIGIVCIMPILKNIAVKNPQPHPALLLIPLLAFLLFVIVQIVLLSTAGQTIGKKMMHIRIVKLSTMQNGGFVTNVLIRSVFNSIISAVPFYVLVDTLFIFRQDRRCIHDLIAETTVIDA